jgi:hypothetical protein
VNAFKVYEAIDAMGAPLDAEDVPNSDLLRVLGVFIRDANDAYAWRLSAASDVQRIAYDEESKWAIEVLRAHIETLGSEGEPG